MESEQQKPPVCSGSSGGTQSICTSKFMATVTGVFNSLAVSKPKECTQWLQPWHKNHLLFGRKAMTSLDSVLKSRDITLPTEAHVVKAMVFPVVMYGCETWTTNKAEHQRIDAFKLWCWRRLLRVLWTARGSNQLILKEISPEYSLEGLMLKF